MRAIFQASLNLYVSGGVSCIKRAICSTSSMDIGSRFPLMNL